MVFNKRPLNASKAYSILLSTCQRLLNFPSYIHADVAGCNIPVADSLLTLGVTLDSTLSINSHVSQLCRQSFFHVLALRLCSHCLTIDRPTANAVVVAIVQSCLDCANSLLYNGTSSSNIHKVARVKDTFSCVVVNQSSISSAERL
jgi:hypothetical protein